jgi:hypothetical protein
MTVSDELSDELDRIRERLTTLETGWNRRLACGP